MKSMCLWVRTAVIATLLASLPEDAQLQVLPASFPAGGTPAAWNKRLRAEFLARYGPPLLPLPASLERSPLFMALRLSPRYMGAGVREAARAAGLRAAWAPC